MENISVSVVYALMDRQDVVRLQCPAGSTVYDAIQVSGLLEKHPEINLAVQQVGVYGVKQHPEFVLSHHDRVEIYRPLLVSPTQARRLRAKS